MKIKKILAMLLVLCLVFAFTACGGTDNGSGENNNENPNNGEQTEPSEPEELDAAVVMENFVKKLQAGNYVVDVKDYVKTTAYSPEMVYFTSNSSINHAFVTANGETFEGYLEQDGLYDVGFVSLQNAIDSLSFLLPNYWVTVSHGNMWDLFYNNVDNPLEFTSYDDIVKTTLLGLRGYGEKALEFMEEVHMLMDAEDPTTVHFTAHIGETGSLIHYDDLDITLQFGVATSDPRIEAWLENPVYPPTRTAWTKSDIGTLDLVFMRDYGEVAVPFPEFASYAMNFDDNAYVERTEILLSDAHATEQDVKDYITVLLNNGYEAVDGTVDGENVTLYHKLLREEKNAYAELYPSYDNGFVLHGGLYFPKVEYNGLDELNKALVENGFAELDETDNLTGWVGEETSDRRTESWAYFFNYDFYVQMRLNYEDREAAEAYFEEYGNKLLEQGLAVAYEPGYDRGTYTSSNEFKSFTYVFSEEDDTVDILFKDEVSLTPEEVNKMISEHGLPEANIHGDIAARDHTMYYHELAGFTGVNIILYQPFDSNEEAEKFLDDYTALMEEQGYDRINPQQVGSYRNFVYFNEELKKYVGFDYFPGENGASVTLELVSIEPEEDESLMLSMVG